MLQPDFIIGQDFKTPVVQTWLKTSWKRLIFLGGIQNEVKCSVQIVMSKDREYKNYEQKCKLVIALEFSIITYKTFHRCSGGRKRKKNKKKSLIY